MDKLIGPGVIDGYASAMLKVAGAEDGEDRVAGELFQLARSFTSNEELRSTLADIRVPIERKQWSLIFWRDALRRYLLRSSTFLWVWAGLVTL